MGSHSEAVKCGVCFVKGRTYVCPTCTKDVLAEYRAKTQAIQAEHAINVAKAEAILSPKTRKYETCLAQRAMAADHSTAIATQRQKILVEMDQDRQRLQRLQAENAQRRANLRTARSRLDSLQQNGAPPVADAVAPIQSKWASVHQRLGHSRRVLVQEIVTLFDLKCVPEKKRQALATTTTTTTLDSEMDQGNTTRKRTTVAAAAAPPTPPVKLRVRDYLEEDSWSEYLIVGRPLPTGYFENFDRDEINTTIGNVIHMSTLVACYLGIKLPFQTYTRSSLHFIHPSLSASSRRTPLHLSETNLDSFALGLAMLNYNIAYLCHSQGLKITIAKASNTLDNLLACCQAPNLGRYTNFAAMMTSSRTTAIPEGRGGTLASNGGHSSDHTTEQDESFELDLHQLAQIIRSRREESSVWGGLLLQDTIVATDNFVDNYFMEEDEDNSLTNSGNGLLGSGSGSQAEHQRSKGRNMANGTGSTSENSTRGEDGLSVQEDGKTPTNENWSFLDVDIVRFPSSNNSGGGLLSGRRPLKVLKSIGSAVGAVGGAAIGLASSAATAAISTVANGATGSGTLEGSSAPASVTSSPSLSSQRQHQQEQIHLGVPPIAGLQSGGLDKMASSIASNGTSTAPTTNSRQQRRQYTRS